MKRYLKLLLLHTAYQFLELIRQPMYVVTTLIFPPMFFWFFGVPNAQTKGAAALMVGSFSCFAILGVVLFQFAIGIAQDKGTPWAHYLRILPLPPTLAVLPRVFSGLLVSLFAVLAVILTGILTTPLDWKNLSWGYFIGTLLLGAIPFTLLGATLGYMGNSKSIVPLANLVYLPLSFAGGLWLPPNALPSVVQTISEYLPTRFFGEMVWAALLQKEAPSREALGMVLYFIVFLATAVIFFKRNQEQEFR